MVIFELDGRRCGVQMGFVDEVITLGPVTPVPAAPQAVAGAMNVRGQVCAILRLDRLLRPAAPGPPPRQGQPSLLVHADDCRVVLCVGRIEGVSRRRDDWLLSSGDTDLLISGILHDGTSPVHLVDVAQVVRRITAQVRESATRLPGPAADDGARR